MARSNSGRDESRNNLHDPTLRDREDEAAEAKSDPAKPEAKAPADRREQRQD